MQLTKISRSKSFEMVNGYGLKSWEKFSLEGELAPRENPLEAYVELGKIIDEAFKEANPKVVEPPKEIQVDKKLPDELKGTLAELEKCLTLDELKGFWLVCKGNLALSTEYKKREKQLTDAK